MAKPCSAEGMLIMTSLKASGRRPANELLQKLSSADFALISPYLEPFDGAADRILHNAGEQVDTVHFPCGLSLAAFVVAIDDDREVEATLVGREGAVGGIVSHGFLPAFSRITVRFAGPFVRLSVARLEGEKRQSRTLADLFFRYADCLLAQLLQATACNATHSIEQRAAKSIVAAVERTGDLLLPLTHERLGMMLGVGRSYATRVIQTLKTEQLVETRRSALFVKDLTGLQNKACSCDTAVKQHFARVMNGLYGKRSSS